MKAESIKYECAIDLMRNAGARLVLMHTTNGSEHFMIPGGPVTVVTAEKIKQHPFVCSGQDGLFPGLDQTWRCAPNLKRSEK